MNGGIDYQTQMLLTPQKLCERYGSAVGGRVCCLIPFVQQSRSARTKLLHTLDELCNDEQRNDFIDTVWDRYYSNVADSILDR